jgi:hypothetical protein
LPKSSAKNRKREKRFFVESFCSSCASVVSRCDTPAYKAGLHSSRVKKSTWPRSRVLRRRSTVREQLPRTRPAATEPSPGRGVRCVAHSVSCGHSARDTSSPWNGRKKRPLFCPAGAERGPPSVCRGAWIPSEDSGSDPPAHRAGLQKSRETTFLVGRLCESARRNSRQTEPRLLGGGNRRRAFRASSRSGCGRRC